MIVDRCRLGNLNYSEILKAMTGAVAHFVHGY